jgi:DNA polymerase-4
VLHVDLDAFFAAVEQLDHPDWRGKPVIVGGDPSRRGVVSTASYEARRFGIRSAMPSARAAKLCPEAIWTPGSFERYGELSRQVFEIFRTESPLVQPVSIDEAFLDVTPGIRSDEHPVAIARRIQERIAELGITGSVGVATSKTVAKIASDYDKPDGLTVVCPGDEASFLAALPARAMSGIGPRTAERLERLGVHTLGDLAAIDPETARQVLGSHGPTLVRRARGIDERPVRDNDPAKQVSNERTFGTDLRESGEIDGVIESLAAKVGQRLRRKGMAGRTVTLKIRFGDFTTRSVQRTLPEPTANEHVVAPVARELLRTVWTPGVGVRLLGVGVSGFDERTEQLSLDDAATSDPDSASLRHDGLVRGVDAVRERFGDDAVRSGRELLRPGLLRKATETPEKE